MKRERGWLSREDLVQFRLQNSSAILRRGPEIDLLGSLVIGQDDRETNCKIDRSIHEQLMVTVMDKCNKMNE